MVCGCGKVGLDRARSNQAIDEIAEYVGLREVFDQSLDVYRAESIARQFLRKAQRAERLQYETAIVSMHLRSAARELRQAIRQIDAVLLRLENRTEQSDWNELLINIQRSFDEHEGVAGSEAMKERFRESLLELDGLEPDMAATAWTIAAIAFDELSRSGLTGPVDLLRRSLLSTRADLTNIELVESRGSLSELSVNQSQVDCISVAVAIAAAAFIVCCFIPWCWCCQSVAIAAFLAVAVVACLDIYG